MIAISILFYTHYKGSEISFLFQSSHRLFKSLTGYPANETKKYLLSKYKLTFITLSPEFRISTKIELEILFNNEKLELIKLLIPRGEEYQVVKRGKGKK